MLAFYWLIDWDRMMPPLRELDSTPLAIGGLPASWKRPTPSWASTCADSCG